MDKIVWSNLCEAVNNNLNLKEMPFEKGIASNFLSVLGWNSLKNNLKEQYVMGHTNWKADFALFIPGKENPEIIVELKKPMNKQNKKNREQISDYLNLKNCRFGLYFGEKLELFFLADINNDERKMKSVMTVEYDKNSPYYKDLLSMLDYSTYSREKLINFCNEQLAIKEACQYWQTQEGTAELIQIMMQQSNLKEELSERFRENIEVLIKMKHEGKSNHDSVFSTPKNTHKVYIPEGGSVSKPRFQFWMAGFNGGETIVFAPTDTKVKVVMPNKVEYQGKQYSLSGFCKSFIPEEQKHKAGSYESTMYFTYQGKTLKEIRNEKEQPINHV